MQIANDHLSIEISERGAELRSITTPDGAEWLWQGDPAWWAGRSPLLFPVVGRSPDNTVTIGGVPHAMPAHGIARISDFAEEARGADWARLVLEDSAATRENYPFAFRLILTYRLVDATLSVIASVTNRDSVAMPFQFGFHPGFCWPLPGGAGQRHSVALANGAEPALYRLDADKLIVDQPLPSPFAAGLLQPEPAMFEADAMLFPSDAGHEMRFGVDNGPSVRMVTANLPHFAIWQKPGAPFLCLEPWHGTAPFADTGNALETRHGSMLLPAGETADFRMELTITSAP
jgi:galactose mutarotase-like enzyme